MTIWLLLLQANNNEIAKLSFLKVAIALRQLSAAAAIRRGERHLNLVARLSFSCV